MKVILLRRGGAHRSFQVSRLGIVSFVGLSVVLGSLAVVALSFGYSQKALETQLVQSWQAEVSAQQARVVAFERTSQAHSAAVGRQLASMQARLLRMEAIGAQIADAADLRGDEFDFSALPAQGGPVQGEQRSLDWIDLDLEIAQLSGLLKRRELELGILEQVLSNQEITAGVKVAGRPVEWGWMSSAFGQRVDPISGKNAWHAGVDFAGRDGSKVVSVASGVVTFAGERYGYGKLVELNHGNGYVTRYGHHQALLVEVGDVVKKGQVIGLMGSSGRSTGPHVHFEVLKNGRAVDPARYVSAR